MKLLFTIKCLLFSFYVVVCQPKIKTTPDSVYIYGKITPVEKKNDLLFFVNDYVLDRQVTYSPQVSEDGKFFARVFIRHTTDILWKHKSDTLFGLLLSPGDSVGIDINGDKTSFFGKNASHHETFQLVWAKRWQQFYRNENDGLKLEPEEFVIWRKRKKEREREWFESLCTNPLKLTRENVSKNNQPINCPERMREWFIKNSEVSYFRDLLDFNWKSLNYGLGSPTRLTGERKRKYDSSFLHTLNFEDKGYKMSSAYSSLINNLSNKFLRWGDTIAIQNQFKAKIDTLLAFKQMLTESDVELLNFIKKSFSLESRIDSVRKQTYYSILDKCDDELAPKMTRWGVERAISESLKIPYTDTRELILCKLFIMYLEADLQVEYVFKRITSLLKNEEYLNAIRYEYNKYLQKALPKEIDSQLIQRDIEKSGKQLIAEVLKQEKGKVVLLDFWATWCGPCRADFDYMRELKKKPALVDISYVYLCGQSTEENWKKVVNQYQIKGKNYFITNRQYVELQTLFKLNAFPTYILVDAQRKTFKHVSVHTEGFLKEIQRAKE